MEVALVGLRLIVGLTFVAHGAQTLFGAFGGDGINRTALIYEQLGLRPGRLNAWVGGCAELFGGLLIALGFLTPVASAVLIADMTTAVLAVHLRNGFFNTKVGFEYNLVLAAAAFALAGIGAGTVSLDAGLDLDLSGTGAALAALAAGLLGGSGAFLTGRLVSQRSPLGEVKVTGIQ